MSGGTKQFLQRFVLTRSLPFLKQGSTLSIRSQLQTDLRIRSHWRDDGQLSFRQHKRVVDTIGGVDCDQNGYGHVLVLRNEDKMTSLGREDPHVEIHLLDKDGVEQLDSESRDRKTLISPSPLTSNEDDEGAGDEEGNILTLDVPDKINIDCDLTEGGSIYVDSKIEGDVQLKTIQGNISVQKLRGHNIDLEIALPGDKRKGDDEGSTKPSFIFVKDVLESQSLRLSVPRPSVDRIRAKRIHAKTMEVIVGADENNETPASGLELDNEKSLFDDDDAGAICDISSLYIIGDASVDIQQSNLSSNGDQRQRQALRIKSHHGHVHVQATAPQPTETNELTGELLPLVDLGGVNGSCEVWVSRPKNEKGDSVSKSTNGDGTSCHVHFDSIAPDSVSLLHADEGDIHVTVDRKVESDVRLLSPPASASIDTETLLLEDNEDGSIADEVSHMLEQIEKDAALDSENDSVTSDNSNTSRIRIETQAFTFRDRIESDQLQYSEFVDGWIENTTSEPDSRFDRKIRGNSGGGKINIDGAQNQALHSFGGEAGDGTEDTFLRPLLAVSSPDKIVLETLSWMGNIARRYGLDDNREDDDLGRQAMRRKGLGREIPTD